MTRYFFAAAALAFVFPATASADDFTVREGLSNVSFVSDATLETITGTTSTVSGTISTNLESPGETTATIAVPVTSLRTGVDLRDEHLHSEQWLNAPTHPNIEFAITSVDVGNRASLSHGETINATVSGTFTLNGATQTITAPAEVSFYEVASDDVSGSYGIDGDILRVETSFDVTLADHNISIAPPLRLKVAPTINVTARLSAIRS